MTTVDAKEYVAKNYDFVDFDNDDVFVPTIKQAQKVMGHVPKGGIREMFMLMFDCFARMEELLELKLLDVDVDRMAMLLSNDCKLPSDGWVPIKYSHYSAIKKLRHLSVVGFGNEVGPVDLDEVLSVMHCEDGSEVLEGRKVFNVDKTERIYIEARRALSKACALYNIQEFSPSAFRIVGALSRYESEKDIEELSYLMRHDNVEITLSLLKRIKTIDRRVRFV